VQAQALAGDDFNHVERPLRIHAPIQGAGTESADT
jgi:hypothetical protein